MAKHEDEVSAVDYFETNTHAFVLRVWREEPLANSGESVWHGHITHVQSGQRRYFQQLREIIVFISTYFVRGEHGANSRLSYMGRLRQWFCRRLHCSGEHSV